MNATDILTARTESEFIALAREAFDAGNNAGVGFDPSDDLAEDDVPVFRAGGFAVYDVGGDAMIVAEADAVSGAGAWAVRI